MKKVAMCEVKMWGRELYSEASRMEKENGMKGRGREERGSVNNIKMLLQRKKGYTSGKSKKKCSNM